MGKSIEKASKKEKKERKTHKNERNKRKRERKIKNKHNEIDINITENNRSKLVLRREASQLLLQRLLLPSYILCAIIGNFPF